MENSPSNLLVGGSIFDLAVCLSDIFGFHPVGEQWTLKVEDYIRESAPKETIGWWIYAHTATFSGKEAAEFADALTSAIVWRQSQPTGFPSYPTPGERNWDWKGLWEIAQRPTALVELLKIRNFASGGPFRVESAEPGNRVRRMIHVDIEDLRD